MRRQDFLQRQEEFRLEFRQVRALGCNQGGKES